MNRSPISKLSDRIFLRISLFLVLFMLAFYLLKSAVLSLFISLIGLLITELTVKALHLEEKKRLTHSQKSAYEGALLSLTQSSLPERQEVFSAFLSAKGFAPKKAGELLLFDRKGTSCALWACFPPDKLTERDLLQGYRTAREQGVSLLFVATSSLTPTALSYATCLTNPKTVVLDGATVCGALEGTGALPEAEQKAKKSGRMRLFCTSLLAESKSKGYFLSAIPIYLLSFFTPFALNTSAAFFTVDSSTGSTPVRSCVSVWLGVI